MFSILLNRNLMRVSVFFFFSFFLVSTGWTRKQGWRKAWQIFSRHRANKLLRTSIEATLWNLHKEAFIKASGPKSPSLCRRHGRWKEGTEARARHTRINPKNYPRLIFPALLPPSPYPINLPSLCGNLRFVLYFVFVDKIFRMLNSSCLVLVRWREICMRSE